MKTMKKMQWALALVGVLILAVLLAGFPPQLAVAQKKQAVGDDSTRAARLAQAELDRAMAELNRATQELRKVDMHQVEKELKSAMKELDMHGKLAKEEIARAMKEIEREMKGLGDEAELKALKEELSKLKFQELAGLEGLKDQLSKEMAIMKEQLNKELSGMKLNLDGLKESLERMRQGLKALEQDGLIKPGEEVDIDFDGDILILNGKRQTKAVSDKYRGYFSEGHFQLNSKQRKVVL